MEFNFEMTNLQVASGASWRVDQVADFEFLEAYPQNPVTRRASVRSKSIPARQRFAFVDGSHIRTGNILVNLHRLIAVILFWLNCNKQQKHFVKLN